MATFLVRIQSYFNSFLAKRHSISTDQAFLICGQCQWIIRLFFWRTIVSPVINATSKQQLAPVAIVDYHLDNFSFCFYFHPAYKFNFAYALLCSFLQPFVACHRFVCSELSSDSKAPSPYIYTATIVSPAPGVSYLDRQRQCLALLQTARQREM
jgi:hypothetical protein